MDIIQFIFQDFWHFIGSLMLLSVIVDGLAKIVSPEIIISKTTQEKKPPKDSK